MEGLRPDLGEQIQKIRLLSSIGLSTVHVSFEDDVDIFSARYQTRVSGRELIGVASIEYGEDDKEIALLDVELSEESETS